MVQKDPVFGATHDRAEVARAIGLKADDLSAEYLPQTVSTGVPFCIVLLRSLEASQRLQLVQHEAQAWTAKNDAQFFYCIAPLEKIAEQEQIGMRGCSSIRGRIRRRVRRRDAVLRGW